jgi:hypothetical protein
MLLASFVHFPFVGTLQKEQDARLLVDLVYF